MSLGTLRKVFALSVVLMLTLPQVDNSPSSIKREETRAAKKGWRVPRGHRKQLTVVILVLSGVPTACSVRTATTRSTPRTG